VVISLDGGAEHRGENLEILLDREILIQ